MATRSIAGSVHSSTLLHSMLVAVVAAALLLALIAGPASASSKGCSVKNKATGRTYSTLQAAVNVARTKATLLVRGTCRGSTDIRKSLRIEGVPGGGWGVPSLLAGDTAALTVGRGARVTATSVVISRGVVNRGTAIFIDVHVKGPKRILNTGTLRLLGKSSVRRTTGVVNSGMLTLGGTTTIRKNPNPKRVGRYEGSVLNTGTVIMNGRSNVGDNVRCPSFGCLVAVFINKGRLVMNHRSSFTDQDYTGAVWNIGTMVMNDHSSVHHNSAGGRYPPCGGGWGGGVYNEGRLVMNHHSSVHHNEVAGEVDGYGICGYEARGAGVYNSGTLVMRGRSTIHDNGPERASIETQGGGIYNGKGGTLDGVLCGGTLANVYANAPDDCYFAE